jgi:hypothetical protein
MEWLIRTGKESWQNRAMARQQKITFGEMRSSAGPIRPIVCLRRLQMRAFRRGRCHWDDDVRTSDLEPKFT